MRNEEFEKKLIEVFSENPYLVASNSQLFHEIIQRMSNMLSFVSLTAVVSLESRGFIYGSIIAHELQKPFVPIFKGGKIKNRELIVESDTFQDYSGKVKSLEIFKNSIHSLEKIALVDDWFETGNTGKSAIQLIKSVGGRVDSVSVIFNDLKLENEEFFRKYNFNYLIRILPEYKKRRINL